METAETTAIVLSIFARVSIFGHIIKATGVTHNIADAVLSATREPRSCC